MTAKSKSQPCSRAAPVESPVFCLVYATVSDSVATCVEDETVDASERFCCEELDLVMLIFSFPYHVIALSSRRSAWLCSFRQLLALLFCLLMALLLLPDVGNCSFGSSSLHRHPRSLRRFELSALRLRFSRALVFDELFARPRADSRVFLSHCSHVLRGPTGCFTSTTLSHRALRVEVVGFVF